jgi:hypothetical protein
MTKPKDGKPIKKNKVRYTLNQQYSQVPGLLDSELHPQKIYSTDKLASETSESSDTSAEQVQSNSKLNSKYTYLRTAHPIPKKLAP